MGLSCLLTSREILFLEKVWPKPSLDCYRSTLSNYWFFRNDKRCSRNPLINYKTTGDVVVFIYNASAMDPASLLSLTPSLNFFFLLSGKD